MGYLSDVVIERDMWVVVAEDAARAWVDLAAEDDLVASVGEAKVASSSA
jgi:hypothetical protein